MNELKEVKDLEVVELGEATEVTRHEMDGTTPDTIQQPPFYRKEA